jgi:ATP-dependent helicase/nuclease subunit B
MKVVFDPDFDGGSWPGPLNGRSAVAGEAWVGEAGFLGLLETTMGLGGPGIPASRRVASLVPTVRSVEGFWSASAEVDPFAAARRLLSWRDFLVLNGWRGQELPDAPRLTALAAVTQGCLPGFADRFLAVENALARRSGEIDSVSILVPAADLPPAWQRLFTSLSRHRTSIEVLPQTAASASGDLGAARNPQFRPTGDGSLQLVRPAGLLEAADSVAAWLAAQESLEGTVIISPEPVLDAALHRYGLPTTGSSATSVVDALLSTVPLVLALGWYPIDPQQCLDLLLLPRSPIPMSVGGGLARALSSFPAVGSPAWVKELGEGLERIEDETRRATVAQRLEDLVRPGVARSESYPASEAQRRLTLLERWLRGHIANAEDPAPFEKALSFGLSTSDVLARSGLTELSAAQLDRVVAEASAGLPAGTPFPAEAGLASVTSPGGIAGPARRILWWNFRRSDPSDQGPIPLTARETSALNAAGVLLEPRSAMAVRQARQWRRPLLHAREELLLVAPKRDSAGEELHPHPLWDEVLASLATGGQPERLTGPAPFGPRRPVATPRSMRPLAQRQVDWIGPSVPLRSAESPSSLETLLGCSLRYALTHPGGLRPGRPGALAGGARLLGIVAHAILERVLAHADLASAQAPSEAADEATLLFDTTGPSLGAPLFLPGAEKDRAAVRRAVCDAARSIIQLARQLGVKAIQVERSLEAPFLDGSVAGRTDVVFTSPAAVLDLKWSHGGRFDLLKNGGALQLAAYARMLSHEEGLPAFPPVAYFILQSSRLIAHSAHDFPGAEETAGPDADHVWAAVGRATRGARDDLARGVIRAPGLEQGDKETAKLSGDSLFVPASCKYCDHKTLCGRALPEKA